MASVIALAVVAAALWMMCCLFLDAGRVDDKLVGNAALKELHDESYERRKDLMQIGFTLIGTAPAAAAR